MVKKLSTTSLKKPLTHNTETGNIYVEMGTVNGAYKWEGGRRWESVAVLCGDMGKNLCPILSQTFLETIGRKISNDDSLVRYFATLAFIQRSDSHGYLLKWCIDIVLSLMTIPYY